MKLEQALAILGKEWPRNHKLHCGNDHGTGKTPSLHLYEHDDSFYCFSCGASGDAYGLIALYTGRPIGDVLREYQDPAARTKGAEPVVTKRDMLSASYARWLNFLGQWHKNFDEVTDWLPAPERAARKERALEIVEDVWGGPLDIGRLDEAITPAMLDDQVTSGIGVLNLRLEREREQRGIFGPGFQSEVQHPRGPSGSRLRGGGTIGQVGSERVAPTEGQHETHDLGDEAFARLLQRRLPGRGGGVW